MKIFTCFFCAILFWGCTKTDYEKNYEKLIGTWSGFYSDDTLTLSGGEIVIREIYDNELVIDGRIGGDLPYIWHSYNQLTIKGDSVFFSGYYPCGECHTCAPGNFKGLFNRRKGTIVGTYFTGCRLPLRPPRTEPLFWTVEGNFELKQQKK